MYYSVITVLNLLYFTCQIQSSWGTGAPGCYYFYSLTPLTHLCGDELWCGISPLLETSGERSDYSLASIKHLGFRRCGQGPSLLALLGQALTAMAQCSPSSCQAGTQPQWDTPCCPYWHLSCKSVCSVFSPLGFSSWQHPRSSLWVWGAKPLAGVFLAAVPGVQRTQCWPYSIRVTQK